MDCNEFIQKLGENPSAQEADFIEHSRACKKCRKLYLEQIELERRLKNIVSEEKSEKLKSKVISAYTRQKVEQKKKIFRFGWVSSMAAVAFAAFLGVKIYQNYSLNNFVLAHIDHELDQLQNTVTVSESRLQGFYRAFETDFLNILPDVVYVEKCWMRTGFGLHLIVSGKQGPVTVLLMPNEDIEMPQAVESSDFSGKIFPIQLGDHGEKGSIALVGGQGEPVDMLAEKIRMAMGPG